MLPSVTCMACGTYRPLRSPDYLADVLAAVSNTEPEFLLSPSQSVKSLQSKIMSRLQLGFGEWA